MPVISTIASDSELPRRAAVVVIGGGIVGTATALELAERGVDVVLAEKGEIGAEQSSRNWGWCRKMGRDPRELPLARIALDLWGGMNERVGAETGFRRCGIVYFSETAEQLAAKEKWFAANARQFGLDTERITAKQAAELLPGSTKRWVGGLYTPSDGRAEPFVASQAIALGARRRGARVFTNCAVRGLETTSGKVSGVVTEKGAIACDAVVLAGGAWSRRFLHNAGIALKQLTVVNSVMRTAPLDTGLTRTGSGGGFTFRKRLDGGFTVTHFHYSVADIVPDSFRIGFDFLPALRLDWSGLRLRLGRRFIDEARLKRLWRLDEVSPFEQVRILDPAPVDRYLDEAAANLKRSFPAFTPMEIAERWGGAIDAVPDAVPVISTVEKMPGLVIATGFSGHGFGLGPGGGKLAAELVMGETPCVDPSPFCYSRQFDGTRPRPTTGL